MKTRLTRATKSTWSLILVVMMILSSFSVSAVSLKEDLNSSSASTEANSSGAPSSYSTFYLEYKVNSGGSNFRQMTSKGSSSTYSYTMTLNAGSNYLFRIRCGTTNGVKYSSGGNMELNKDRQLYEYNNDDMFGLTITTTGNYTITFNKNSAYFLLSPDLKSLGTYATLTAYKSSTTAADAASVTLTLDIENGQLALGKEYKVNLYLNGESYKNTTFTSTGVGDQTCSIAKVLENKPSGTYKFKAVVSTDATDNGVGYTTLTTDEITVTIKHNEDLYYISASGNARPTGTASSVSKSAVTAISYAFDNDPDADVGKSYSVVIYDVASNFKVSNCVTDFEVDSSKNENIESITLTTTNDFTYYVVKCSKAGYGPTIYLDYTNKTNPKIYAKAKLAPSNSGKTLENGSKTVTYYFAEPTYNDGDNISLSGPGVKIKYWNSSYYYAHENDTFYFEPSDEYIYLTNYPSTWKDTAQAYFYGNGNETVDGEVDNGKIKFKIPATKYTNVIFRMDDAWTGQTSDLDAKGFVQGNDTYDYNQGKWTERTATTPHSGISLSGTINVTTPVGYNGGTVADGVNNTIYVQYGELFNKFADRNYNSTETFSSKVQGFKVYKCELPIWATSFAFLDNNGNEIATDNAISIEPETYNNEQQNYKNNSATIALNPNRIYLLFDNDDKLNYGQKTVSDDTEEYAYNNSMPVKHRCRGIILDEHLWANAPVSNHNKSDSATNQVTQEGFKTNGVKYNTQYNGGGNENSGDTGNNWFNKQQLSSKYYNSYPSNSNTGLYFGLFGDTDPGLNKFKLWNNLAFRNNGNESYYYASVQNLVGDELGGITNRGQDFGTLKATDKSTAMPLFNYTDLASSDIKSKIRTGTEFEFNKSKYNGITTYSYDSTTDYNRNWNGTKFANEKKYRVADVGANHGLGLFPFFDDNNSKDVRHKERYGYGMEFDINFYMTSTGALEDSNGNSQDIVFNFSGDDDVWVFIDGYLALDLGGSHKVSSASINFTDMKVYYKTATVDTREATSIADTKAVSAENIITADLNKILSAHDGYNFNNKDNTKEHTFQMFYMERGCFDSNCSISFNLPQSTGLTVSNEVKFDSINDGLLDDTIKAANQDYFTYTVSNKLATNAEYSTVNNYYKNGSSNSLKQYSEDNIEYKDSDPLFPIKTSIYDVRRSLLNGTVKNLLLTGKVTDNSDSKSCSKYWSTETPLEDSAFLSLKDQNFKLSDSNAVAYDDENVVEEGEKPASGKTNAAGTFGLLFGQSASFQYKIPGNTIIQIKQNDILDTVESNDTALHVIGDVSGSRRITDYYTTSYKIKDNLTKDASNQPKVIGEKSNIHENDDASTNNTAVYIDDKSYLSNSFYFSNYSYSGRASESVSMNVDCVYKCNSENIVIRKELANNDSTDDVFKFTVKFKNILGRESELKEYKKLKYDIYSIEGDGTTPEASGVLYSDISAEDQTNYPNGYVKFTADQYVVISGVPVGTKYEINEIVTTGYAVDDISLSVENVNNNYTEPNAETEKEDNKTVFTGKVTGKIPLCNNKNESQKSNSSTTYLTYTNKSTFKITFKYYPREVVTGTAAHISETATETPITITRKELAANKAKSNSSKYSYSDLIDTAYSKLINLDSVINEYFCWNSQAKAIGEDGILGQINFHENPRRNYKTSDGNINKHANAYGQLNGTDATEDWVSYKDSEKETITETNATGDKNADVNEITVWLFNNLREYTLTLHYAKTSADLDGKIGTKSKDITAFYNIRVGKSDEAGGVLDSSTAYLEQQYNIKQGYTGDDLDEEVPEKLDNDQYFQYWTYDKAGKYIASTQREYMYRITKTMDLYAVYGDSPYNDTDDTKVGLTVYPNQPDYYFDESGTLYAKLNTVMSPYNYSAGHTATSYDTNITSTMVIYIQDRTDNDAFKNKLQSDPTDVKEKISDEVVSVLASSSNNEIKATVTVDGNYAAGLKYTIASQSEAEKSNGTKAYLTSKNRMQFSNPFKVESMSMYKNLYTFAAMKYGDNWKLSDNCVHYKFEPTGKVETADYTF